MVDGIDKLNRRWKAIPEAVKVNVRAAMEDAANDLVEEMWARAPQGETGRLGASIGWTWGDAPKGALTIGTVGGKEYGSLRITIYAGGDEAFYAKFVEFGTRPHSLERNASVARAEAGSRLNQRRQMSRKQHPGTPAQPFFFPTYRARKKRIKLRISRAISKAIKESR